MSYPILRFPDFKTKAVTLSFDDGSIDDRKMVEILNRYGIKCTFNISSGQIEGHKDTRVQFSKFETLYKGHEIACHGYEHPLLSQLDLGGISYQIVKDRELLEEKTGCIVDGFAYPFGLTETEGMVDCIRGCGIKYARTTVSTDQYDLPADFMRWNPTCKHDSDRFPRLVERFLAPDDVAHPWRVRPKLFYIWGHSYEFKNDWDHLVDVCEAIGKKEGVWYATNMEIYNYVSAFRALRRSVNGRILHNPTDADIYVAIDGKDNLMIPKGKTIHL